MLSLLVLGNPGGVIAAPTASTATAGEQKAPAAPFDQPRGHPTCEEELTGGPRGAGATGGGGGGVRAWSTV